MLYPNELKQFYENHVIIFFHLDKGIQYRRLFCILYSGSFEDRLRELKIDDNPIWLTSETCNQDNLRGDKHTLVHTYCVGVSSLDPLKIIERLFFRHVLHFSCYKLVFELGIIDRN